LLLQDGDALLIESGGIDICVLNKIGKNLNRFFYVGAQSLCGKAGLFTSSLSVKNTTNLFESRGLSLSLKISTSMFFKKKKIQILPHFHSLIFFFDWIVFVFLLISPRSKVLVVFVFTWTAICSKRFAAPLFSADSWREPASTKTPTVALPEEGFSSVATVRPLGKVVMRVAADCLAAVAKGRTNYLKKHE
jgi:hypothetical protein